MSPSSTASVRGGLLRGSYSNGAAADYGVYEICPIQWEISVISASTWILLPKFLSVISRFSSIESQYVEETKLRAPSKTASMNMWSSCSWTLVSNRSTRAKK